MNYIFCFILISYQIILIFQYKVVRSNQYRLFTSYIKLLTSFEMISYQELHQLGLSCLKQSNSPYGYHDIPFHTIEERNQEYLRLLNLTISARKYPTHSWDGYNGPWTEDVWISTFCCNKNISEFGPYIPVFVPWLNIFKKKRKIYKNITQIYFKMLKKDFLYITVSQSSYGIEGSTKTWDAVPPNLLIIAPSGRGHIPIFLHKGEQQIAEPLPKNNTILFIGKLKRIKRNLIVKNFQKFFKENITVFHEKVEDWQNLYRRYDLILSPRGNGRGCFRTTETLLMGLIPILAFDDFLWVPYLNSSFPWKDIGFYLLPKDVEQFVNVVNKLTPERINFMRKTIVKYRDSHVTMNGTMNQIRLFMKYGYKKSDLRCDKYHPTN